MSTLTFNDRLIKMSDVLEYFALSLTKNSDDAKDLLQETMVKALTYQSKYTPNTNFKAWLHTIMKNTFINQYRKMKRANTVITTKDDVEVLDFVPASVEHTPDSTLAAKEINKVIDSLDNNTRIPFTMHLKGFKYKEIAAELNIPIGTVKSRIFFAKQSLMKDLKDYRN
ncbi:MAG: RNA polymerase sigma factor [Flavobacteriales bacterium]|nr:RNA polymerase sigma factor [Flavobacteriales bacterium]